ncbi:MAG: HlyC/CorC family transporter [Elusimicrobia bacterium]|nr:HlyC/CorC family transporter [Elusimicrobiota bacterium]
MSTIIGIITVKLLFLALLLMFTVFFTASETALTVLRRSQIKKLIKEKGVKNLEAWLNNPNKLLTTTLVGTAMSVVGVSVLGTTIAIDMSSRLMIPESLATSASTLIIVVIVLVFAEIVPKAFGRRNAERVSSAIIGPLRIIDFIFTPVVAVFTFLSDFVIKIFGGKPLREQPLFNIEEIEGLIEMGVREGVIATTEKKMLSQIMEFSGTVVREVMVPRVDMKFLNIDKAPAELIGEAIKLRHSRIPVFKDIMDNIIGVLYVKDLLPALVKGETLDIRSILRKPYFIPETKRIGDLLREFKGGREHIAIVVDEYGISTGLVTIEDVLEEITGDIFDEYDVKEYTIKKVSDRSWEIDASEDLDKINDELSLNLPEDKYDSLGGLIVGELGSLPSEGDVVKFGKYRFHILKATPKRILKVRLETA